jgi:hypothetical protein
MSIKIEVGKYYKDCYGNVIGPMVPYENSEYSFKYLYTDSHGFQRYECFMDDGSYYRDKTPCYRDLIEEVDEMNQSESNVQKPPIGLLPQNIFLELQNKQRVQDILDACSRYNEANMNIPQEWIDELSSRRGEIKIEAESKDDNVVPDYMQDFEHGGSTYSVVEDITPPGCGECYFHQRNGCVAINATFVDITGFECHNTPIRIHFVKKAE